MTLLILITGLFASMFVSYAHGKYIGRKETEAKMLIKAGSYPKEFIK